MADHVMVLVGTTKGAFLFHSDERRRDWRMTGPYLPGWEVSCLIGDNRHGHRLYAGTGHFVYGTTIRVSDDFGETWAEVPHGPQYSAESGTKLERIWQIAPGHSSQPDTLYAGVAEAGLFASHDRGQTWNEVSSLAQHPTRPYWFPGGGGMCLHTILIDPNNAKRIWVAISAVGAFRTEDGGESWQLCTTGLQTVPTGFPDEGVGRCVHKMVLDPKDSNTLYMQFHGGVYTSNNAGDSWTPIENGLPGVFGFPMSITPSGTLFVIPLESDEKRFAKDGKLSVYRSRNGGKSWEDASVGLTEQAQFVGVLRDSMAVDQLDQPGVYFGTNMGEIFYSLDEGDHWERLPAQLPRITSVKTWVVE